MYILFSIGFREKYLKALKADDMVTGVSYNLLESQIWSLLSSFCSNPSDISTSFRVRLNFWFYHTKNKHQFLFFLNITFSFFHCIFTCLFFIVNYR